MNPLLKAFLLILVSLCCIPYLIIWALPTPYCDTGLKVVSNLDNGISCKKCPYGAHCTKGTAKCNGPGYHIDPFDVICIPKTITAIRAAYVANHANHILSIRYGNYLCNNTDSSVGYKLKQTELFNRIKSEFNNDISNAWTYAKQYIIPNGYKTNIYHYQTTNEFKARKPEFSSILCKYVYIFRNKFELFDTNYESIFSDVSVSNLWIIFTVILIIVMPMNKKKPTAVNTENDNQSTQVKTLNELVTDYNELMDEFNELKEENNKLLTERDTKLNKSKLIKTKQMLQNTRQKLKNMTQELCVAREENSLLKVKMKTLSTTIDELLIDFEEKESKYKHQNIKLCKQQEKITESFDAKVRMKQKENNKLITKLQVKQKQLIKISNVAEKLNENIKQILSENNIVSGYKETECVICMDKNMCYVCIPCGHYCLCEICKDKIKECPMCLRKCSTYRLYQ